MPTPKLSTWVVANAVPTIHPKASAATDVALTVTGDSIIKNGKPAGGTTINLTVAHVRSAGFAYSYDEANRTFTIKRNEGNRGRKPRTATPADALATALASLQK